MCYLLYFFFYFFFVRRTKYEICQSHFRNIHMYIYTYIYCVWINSDEKDGSGCAAPFQHLSFIRLLCKYNLICYCSSFLATFICCGLAWEYMYTFMHTIYIYIPPLCNQKTKPSIFVAPLSSVPSLLLFLLILALII